MSHKNLLAALPAAALCAALCGNAPQAAAQTTPAAVHPDSSTSPAGTSAGTAATHSTGAPGQQGMVVVRDTQTGQLRAPTPAEARALAPAPTTSMRAPSQPALVTHPGGARQVRLGERGLVYSVVTRGPDGKLAEQCVHGAAAADKAVGAAQPNTQHTEEHRHDVR